MTKLTAQNLQTYCDLTAKGAQAAMAFIAKTRLNARSSYSEIDDVMHELLSVVNVSGNESKTAPGYYYDVISVGPRHDKIEAYFLDRGDPYLNSICYDLSTDTWCIDAWGNWAEDYESEDDWDY